VVVYAAAVAVWRPRPVAGSPPADGLTRLTGVVHVHTTASDGAGTPEEVIAAAGRAGLDFLVITDHNNLDAKRVEGYHGRLLVIVGAELSTTAGHIVALGIPDPLFRFSGDASDVLDDVAALRGYAFAAHPDRSRPDFLWTGWDLPGPWGVEVWNADSQGRADGWPALAAAALRYPLNPRYALLRSLTPPAKTLGRWDALLGRRDAAAIAGADAHGGVRVRGRWLRAPSYEALFGLGRVHVLLPAAPTGRAGDDVAAVVQALGSGRSYVSLDALADGGGFFFRAGAGARQWQMGETAPPGPSLRLSAGGAMPEGTRLTLLRNGAPVATAGGGLEAAASQPGAYRVEARVDGWETPWIVSNPIYVFDAAAATERAARALWPAPAPAPPARQTIDSFDGETTFAAEHDPSSTMAEPIIDAHGGTNGTGAARLAFRLGVPSPAQPHTWCALVSRQPRDLSAARGLVFAIRGDGMYRAWVQVRDANPASADDGEESWFASVRTAPEWRRVAVPFAALRSINKASDGRLDLDKVRGLVFVLDRGAVKPGTRGTIWLDDVGVY
jgi:hypothetical protein